MDRRQEFSRRLIAAFDGKRGVYNQVPVQRQRELGNGIPIAAVTDFVFAFTKIGNMFVPEFGQITYGSFGSKIGVANYLIKL